MKIKGLINKFGFKSFMTIINYYDTFFGAIEKKVKGIDFLAHLKPDKLGEGYDYDKYVHYVPSKRWQVRKVITVLKITNEDSILDIGCGKGKAVFEFSKFNFKKISGVELSGELACVAKKNMKKLNLLNIEIFNENALNFKALDDYNIFYFYDPFNKNVFKIIVENIIESCNKNQREIRLVYINPRGHKEILDNHKGFVHFKTIQIPMKALFYKYLPS